MTLDDVRAIDGLAEFKERIEREIMSLAADLQKELDALKGQVVAHNETIGLLVEAAKKQIAQDKEIRDALVALQMQVSALGTSEEFNKVTATVNEIVGMVDNSTADSKATITALGADDPVVAPAPEPQPPVGSGEGTLPQPPSGDVPQV